MDKEELDNLVDKIILGLWGIFSIFFFGLVVIIGVEIYIDFFKNKFDLKNIGYFILSFELILVGLKAIKENGHFPVRYLPVFLATALVFYTAINKSSFCVLELWGNIFAIVILITFNILINITNKKYSIKD